VTILDWNTEREIERNSKACAHTNKTLWRFSSVKESVHENKSKTASKEVKTVKIELEGCSYVTSSYLSVPWRIFQY